MNIKIIDSTTGQPLQGATIQFNRISATNNPDFPLNIETLSTAATGASGTINYTGQANQIKVTFVGYKPQTIPLTGLTQATVRMEREIKETSVTITAEKRPPLFLFVILLLLILFLMYKSKF